MIWIVTDSDQQIELGQDERLFKADSFDGVDIELSANKSRYPISKNNNKSDHISLDPRRLRFEGCIGSQGFAKGVDLFDGETDRTLAACDLLVEMWRSKQCATIVYKGKTYENMALLSAPIRCTIDGRMSFSLEYEEFDFYDISETFDATIGRKVDLGEVATTSGNPAFITDQLTAAELAAQADFGDCASQCLIASNTQCLDDCYQDALDNL